MPKNKTTAKISRFQRHRERVQRVRKHPFIVPVITFLVLFFITLAALVNFNATTVGPGDKRVVQLFVDGQSRTLPTRAPTVGELLKRLDITLRDQDMVEPGLDTPILDDNFKVNVYRARPVTVADGGKKVTVLTAKESPERIVQDAGFALTPEDKVVAATPAMAADQGVIGENLVVERAFSVTLNLYGQPVVFRTLAKTVDEFLREKNIMTQPSDTIRPSLDAPLAPGAVIEVLANGTQVKTIEEAIAFPTETVDDPAATLGSKTVRQAGVPGKKVVTYEIVYDAGKEVSRKLIQEVKVSDPVKEIVVKGTKVVTLTGSKVDWMTAAGISPSDFQYVDYIMGRESGWRPNAVSSNRCIGLGQRCNAQILINACPSWETDPVCQLQHFSAYAGRYGGWQGAYNAWQTQHWW